MKFPHSSGVRLLEDIHHPGVVILEPGDGFLPWKTAKRLGIPVQRVCHDQQAGSIAGLVLAGAFPTREIAFGHIEHVTDHIAHFPLGAARLHVPVLGYIHNREEVRAILADDIQDSILTAIVHRIYRWHSINLLWLKEP